MSRTPAPTGPIALMVPGAGSTPDFLERSFAAPLRRHGLRLVTLDLRGVTPGSELAALDETARGLAPRLVGGVSFGAHLALRWAVGAAQPSLQGVLAVMPAWTGPAGPVASLTAASAERVATTGSPGLLAELARDVPVGAPARWIVEELHRAWPTWGDAALAGHLAGVATAAGPDPGGLAGLAVPLAAVALAGDPLHPHAVARRWVRTVGTGALATVELAAPGSDPEALGVAAVRALVELGL